MKHLAYTLLFSLLVLGIACKNDSKGKSENKQHGPHELHDSTGQAEAYYLKIFQPYKKKVFRDIVFDYPIDSVLNIEKHNDLKLTDQKSNYLQYEYDLSIDTVKGIDYVMVKYIFDDADRLDIITVNYYIQDSLGTHNFYDQLNHSLQTEYGDYYIDSDGYTVWESAYKRKDSIDVAYDIAIRKLVKFEEPGVTIEFMRFGEM